MATDQIDLDNAVVGMVKAHHELCEVFRNYTLEGKGDTDSILLLAAAGFMTWEGIKETRRILKESGVDTRNADAAMEKHSQWADATIIAIMNRNNKN